MLEATINVPHSTRAEKAVLGCLLLDGMSALEQCQRLRPEMLALDSHRRIYRTAMKMLEEGGSLDSILLAENLRKSGEVESVGGIPYILDLTDLLPRNFNPAAHVETIIEKWKLRTGMNICDRYASQFADEAPSDATLSLMQAEVF